MPPPDARHDDRATTTGAGHAPRAGVLTPPPGRESWRALDGDRSARERDAGGALGQSFLAHFLRAPALVGGVVPSSRFLGRAMSRHAAGFDAIVELGAGEGSITRFLAADHPRATLTVIERSPEMAHRIARGWPRAFVRAGCVHERADALLDQPARAVAVSSLPFRSLPGDLARTTSALIERFLLAHPERRLVQYSYGLREPFALASPRLRWHRAERVWRNVPPAIVWMAGQRVGGG
jgi:phospholipid N-methyltransferase